MPDDQTIKALAELALEKNSRTIEILTTFLQEASVLVLVFGILDTYAAGKLSHNVISIVLAVGLTLLAGAFSVRWIVYRFMCLVMRFALTVQERLPRGDE